MLILRQNKHGLLNCKKQIIKAYFTLKRVEYAFLRSLDAEIQGEIENEVILDNSVVHGSTPGHKCNGCIEL